VPSARANCVKLTRHSIGERCGRTIAALRGK
jgi:hypothetical protein